MAVLGAFLVGLIAGGIIVYILKDAFPEYHE